MTVYNIGLNTSFPKNIYTAKGYCALISYFIIHVLHNNIMVHDCFNINTYGAPDFSIVSQYIENMLPMILHIFSIDKNVWWIFLCNNARTLLQDITFPKQDESLSYYKMQKFHENDSAEKIFDEIKNYGLKVL